MATNFLIDIDNKIFVAKSEDYQTLENYAQDDMVENYDIVDTQHGFSKAYPTGELIVLYSNLTEEVDGIDFDFSDTPRPEIVNRLLSELVKPTIDVPTIEATNGGLPMAPRKKAAVKKKAVAKKKAVTQKAPTKKATPATSGAGRKSTAGTQKVKRGDKPKSEGSVQGAIYAYCSKQMTIDDVCDGMVMDGYTSPRGAAVDASYIRGYVSAMVRSGELVKV